MKLFRLFLLNCTPAVLIVFGLFIVSATYSNRILVNGEPEPIGVSGQLFGYSISAFVFALAFNCFAIADKLMLELHRK